MRSLNGCHLPTLRTALPHWMAKAVNEIEMERAERVICLLPARTDTAWWHRYVLPFAAEIHYLRGRIRFEGAGSSAPFRAPWSSLKNATTAPGLLACQSKQKRAPDGAS